MRSFFLVMIGLTVAIIPPMVTGCPLPSSARIFLIFWGLSFSLSRSLSSGCPEIYNPSNSFSQASFSLWVAGALSFNLNSGALTSIDPPNNEAWFSGFLCASLL